MAESPGGGIRQLLGDGDADAAARRRALEGLALHRWRPTDTVSYRSAGRVLVIGPGPTAAEAAAGLAEPLQVTVLASSAAAGERPPVRQWLQGVAEGLRGHLGDFRVAVAADGDHPAREAGPYDVVLDLGARPLSRVDVPPPGYFAVADADSLETALAAVPELVGEFQKPRYFDYDADICAHGRSGIGGCTRCLDTCPTGAITSLRERIEVDPYLCQGGGVCATACPSGAIRYAAPPAGEWLDRMRGLLRDYREGGGEAAVLLLHDAGDGASLVAEQAASLPGRVLPVEVEEVASVGMDGWLALLAYGAWRVAMLVHDGVPAGVRDEIDRQLDYARAVLDGLGYAPRRLLAVRTAGHAAAGEPLPAQAPATFAAVGSKRELLRVALGHLQAHAPRPASSAPLPAGAPFGEVVVDKQACTLCMSCVSVCPVAALSAGGDTPALRFVEWNCVQCGLCERACPEDAITRHARVLYEPRLQRETRTLNEEPPFLCVGCGKPFATQSVMRRMQEKLAGHWMYQQPGAMRRLQMCEDCRVRDMFEKQEMP